MKKFVAIIMLLALAVGAQTTSLNVTYTWSAPTTGSAVHHYVVQTSNNGTTWTTLAAQPTSPSATVAAPVGVQQHGRCGECRVPHGAVGYRWPDTGGNFAAVPLVDRQTVTQVLRHLRGGQARLTRIVLTVHHRDCDPTNNANENLVALCQRCHLRADRALRDAAKDAGKS